MVEDEDEEDDDDDEDDDDVGDRDDPLGKGIDSVSWLPTVIGAKDMATSTSTREVSWAPPMRYFVASSHFRGLIYLIDSLTFHTHAPFFFLC